MSETPSVPADPRRVASSARGELFAHWLAAVVVTVLFGAVGVGVWVGEVNTPSVIWDRVLLGLAALGPLLLVRALVETARWRRFRSVELELDPVPGSLGGEVGGRIEVPVRLADPEAFRVQLSCIQVRPGSDSTWESVVWAQEVQPSVYRGANGARVEFAIPVPADLPATSEPSGTHHRWAVRLLAEVPGLDLDLAFNVPVRKVDPPLESSIRTMDPRPTRDDPHLGPGISVSTEAGARVFRYGVTRSLGMGVALLLFGALTLGAGVLVFGSTFRGFADADVFGLVFTLFGGFFLLVLGLVGLLLLVLGISVVGTTRRVEVTPGRIRARWRFLLLFGSAREVAVEEIDRVEARVVGQVGQGAKASVRYELRATTRGGDRIVLGDGIRGPGNLARVVDLLERETGLQVQRSEKKSVRERAAALRKARG